MSYRIFDIKDSVIEGGQVGHTIELDNGDLLCGNSLNGVLKKKKVGFEWSTVLEVEGNNPSLKSIFYAKNKSVYVQTGAREPFIDHGLVYRSIDGGDTWNKVLTGESSAFWRLAEDSSGAIYAPEYSAGLGDAEEMYGRHVWKSMDNGSTWSKWFSGTLNEAPTYRQGFRHIHGLYISSNDVFVMGCGDTTVYQDGGKTFRLNSSGVITQTIALYQDGNGWTAFCEADNGDLFYGGDVTPVKIYKYIPGTGGLHEAVDLVSFFGSDYNDISTMVTGKHGVLYGATTGNVGADRKSRILASGDDGVTWVSLEYQNTADECSSISINTNVENSRLLIGLKSTNFISIPDYTKAEIVAMYSGGDYHGALSTLTIKTS